MDNASTSRALLAVDGLVVRYGHVTAVDGASIHVDHGEIVSIIGPNGAGKSSLLGAIAGLVRPVAGSIAFAGENTVGNRWSGPCAVASRWCWKGAMPSPD